MQKRQIVNVINFIRGCEPRKPTDLFLPVREQIRLLKEHGLKGTFLVQYDALILPEYQTLLKSLDPAQFEIGVWFETVQEQVERAGLPWRGRFPWDWHTHCGFSVGYTKEEREKLVDVLFREFKAVFGYYPRVFGSWLFDSHTIRYITETYGLDAICNCKEQYGTDGYTLWGGYYGQGYYPSRTNVFLPAQTQEQQINVPLFRMLGADPVYQYDIGLSPESGARRIQRVITLEPVYTRGGGGVPAWVDWYFRENFNGECLSFGYTQVGQENSFGWPRMENGLTYQLNALARLQKEGKITVERLGETGRWYKETYKSTPPSAITVHSAYDDEMKNSVWYSTKFYRVNLYGNHGTVRIRDLHVFCEAYPDPYENAVCTENVAVYESLPVVDGNRHSGNGVIAGGYITYADGSKFLASEMAFTDLGDGSARVSYGEITVELYENGMRITAPKPFEIENHIGTMFDHLPTVVDRTEERIVLDYHGTTYALRLEKGRFTGDTMVKSEQNEIFLTVEV